MQVQYSISSEQRTEAKPRKYLKFFKKNTIKDTILESKHIMIANENTLKAFRIQYRDTSFNSFDEFAIFGKH